MAAVDPTLSDPLLSLRRAIAAQALPTPTTSSELSNENATEDLAEATYLYFTHPIPQSITLSSPTRFVSAATESPVDLRSIYFAWLKKDVAIPEYIASAQELNDALKEKRSELESLPEEEGDGGEAATVQNLVFVERLDLITWLEGASDESEYIKALEGAASGLGISGPADAPPAGVVSNVTATVPTLAVTSGVGTGAGGAAAAAGGVVPVVAAGAQATGAVVGGRLTKIIDPRLQEIYNGERKLGDRNTVLRGIKPTDFSHVRKTAELFLGRSRSRPGQLPSGKASSKQPPIPAPSAGLSLPKKPGMPGTAGAPSASMRRPEPIILLSPSASSLIRMSNIRSFLEDGVFVPPDHPSVATSTPSNILQIVRPLRISTDPSNPNAAGSVGSQTVVKKPTRFILVDTTANFKPDYWQRLVAVFTTGQTWQFKSYKWTTGHELFKHVTGIYVGWRGEDPPREVKGWGRGVKTFVVERWDEKGGAHGAGRWRDREVVEGIWMAIEEGMKSRGWDIPK